ncbi:MAG: hypothetical protein JEZ07_11705 [Phycisphaerae bacterium]|nr:hypothetical protein [Phycisphaerae bacterium]
MSQKDKSPEGVSENILGIIIYACVIIGIISFAGALIISCSESDYIGSGIWLLASALSFGLAANAMMRE